MMFSLCFKSFSVELCLASSLKTQRLELEQYSVESTLFFVKALAYQSGVLTVHHSYDKNIYVGPGPNAKKLLLSIIYECLL